MASSNQNLTKKVENEANAVAIAIVMSCLQQRKEKNRSLMLKTPSTKQKNLHGILHMRFFFLY